MRYVDVGGTRLSVVGLGTWQFGSREWGYGSSYAEGEAGRILDRALDLGVNFIDTAEIYGMGESERIVGRALAGRRDEAFIATKIFPLAALPPVVAQRARGSARRLDVNRIDLYQVHWPNPVIPVSTTMAGMRRVMDSGLVAHAGVSNFSLSQWQAAERELGKPVLSNQVRFSLVDRRPLTELIPWASQNDRLVIAYSPLGQGLLSGRYDRDHLPAGLRALTPQFLPENLDRLRPLILRLSEIASSHDATPSQVALAWVLRQKNVLAIPGASSVSQLEANVDAANLDLDEAEWQELDQLAARCRPRTGPLAGLAVGRSWAERKLSRLSRH